VEEERLVSLVFIIKTSIWILARFAWKKAARAVGAGHDSAAGASLSRGEGTCLSPSFHLKSEEEQWYLLINPPLP
jgi:hypothetical protein